MQFRSRLRRTAAAAGVIALTALTLTACTGQDAPAPPSTPSSTSPSASAATSPSPSPSVEPSGSDTGSVPAITEIPAVPEAETNASGDVLKELGGTAELLDGRGRVVATVTVHGTQVLQTCPGEFAVAPSAGNYVVADVSATMTDAAASDALLLVGPAMWRIIGPDGEAAGDLETDAAWQCFETAERLPNFVGPGEEVHGRLVLDSAITTGELIFSPTGGGGWSWPLD